MTSGWRKARRNTSSAGGVERAVAQDLKSRGALPSAAVRSAPYQTLASARPPSIWTLYEDQWRRRGGM